MIIKQTHIAVKIFVALSGNGTVPRTSCTHRAGNSMLTSALNCRTMALKTSRRNRVIGLIPKEPCGPLRCFLSFAIKPATIFLYHFVHEKTFLPLILRRHLNFSHSRSKFLSCSGPSQKSAPSPSLWTRLEAEPNAV